MTAAHVHGLMVDLLALRERQAATFEERAAAFVAGLRALTRQTGIVVSAEALEGENAQVTLADQPKGAGRYRSTSDGGIEWRSTADHEAEKERCRASVRAMGQAVASKERSMATAERGLLALAKARLAVLESEPLS